MSAPPPFPARRRFHPILLAEDEPGLNRLLVRRLGEVGWPVTGVTSGREAVALVLEQEDRHARAGDHLLLLDFYLGDMTADEVVSRLHAEDIDPPFVVMTGRGDQEVAVTVMRRGARNYIVKEFGFVDELVELLHRVERELALEAELQEKEHRLADAERLARIGTWDWDVESNTLTWSDELYRIFGLAREFPLTFESIETHLHPEDRPRNTREVERLFAGADVACWEFRIVRPDGETRHLVQHVEVTRAVPGSGTAVTAHSSPGCAKVTRVIGTMQDVTEQKRADERARREGTRWTRTFDAIADPVCLLDPAQRVLQVNAAMAQLFADRPGGETPSPHPLPLKGEGMKGRGLVGRVCCEVVHGSLEPPEGCPFERMLVSRRRECAEVSVAGRCWQVTVDPVFAPDGSLESAVHVMSDVTGQKQAEAELGRHRENLEELVAERTAALHAAQDELVRRGQLATLGRIAGSIAHEIRNPLSTILNAAYFLRSSVPGMVEGRPARHLELIVEETARANRVISRLLEMARGEAPKPVRCEVAALVAAALALVDAPPGVRVVRADEEQWPASEVDPDQLESALANVIKNAVEACGARGTVRVSAGTEDGMAAVRVADDGPGIPPEQLDRVFEPLFTTRAVGSGLGLPIARAQVEANRGFIAIESEVGRGTVVIIRLPLPGSP